jgi:hypothetical protein
MRETSTPIAPSDGSGRRAGWHLFNYLDNQAYRNSVVWYKSFRPDSTEVNQYAIALTYAKEKLKEISDVAGNVDKKLESMFALTATLATVLFGITGVYKSNVYASLPSLVFFMITMTFCLFGRIPMARSSAVTVKDALERVGKEKSYEAWLASSIYCAITGLKVTTSWKTVQLRRAMLALIAGIGLLLLPMLYRGPVTDAKPQTSSSTLDSSKGSVGSGRSSSSLGPELLDTIPMSSLEYGPHRGVPLARVIVSPTRANLERDADRWKGSGVTTLLYCGGINRD